MNHFTFRVDLLADVVVSASTATAGAHQSLDYLPGAVFLGVAASQLYAALSQEEVWTVFHSGRVRFGNARPLIDNKPAWPVPLAWHEAKRAPACVNGQLDPQRLFNLVTAEAPDDRQIKALRGGYVDATGRLLKPRTRLRLKTAINPDTQLHEDGQLFGYQSLTAGQSFAGRVDIEDGVPNDLLERIRETLEGNQFIGRSRSAEYGQVRITTDDTPRVIEPTSSQWDKDRCTIWLLSDLALVDAYGKPTLAPRPDHLGLNSGVIDWHRSFIRTRSYTSFNRYRRSHDMQRDVLMAGSVLTLRLSQGPPENWPEHSLGCNRESGLGDFCLNPALLATSELAFEPIAQPATAACVATPVANPPPLVLWLRRRSASESPALREAQKLRLTLVHLYTKCRNRNGLGPDQTAGPSPSQWSSVRTAAQHATGDALIRALFRDTHAVCKPTGKGWQDDFLAVEQNSGKTTFHEWLKQAVGKPPDPAFTRALARVGSEVAREHHHGDSA